VLGLLTGGPLQLQQPLPLGLRPLEFSHVPDLDHDRPNRAVLRDGGHRAHHGDVRPVGPDHDILVLAGAPVQGAVRRGVRLPGAAAVKQVVQRASARLGRGDTREPLGGGVHVGAPAVLVGEEQRRAGMVRHGPQKHPLTLQPVSQPGVAPQAPALHGKPLDQPKVLVRPRFRFRGIDLQRTPVRRAEWRRDDRRRRRTAGKRGELQVTPQRRVRQQCGPVAGGDKIRQGLTPRHLVRAIGHPEQRVDRHHAVPGLRQQRPRRPIPQQADDLLPQPLQHFRLGALGHRRLQQVAEHPLSRGKLRVQRVEFLCLSARLLDLLLQFDGL
jgi:hypothetical protein